MPTKACQLSIKHSAKQGVTLRCDTARSGFAQLSQPPSSPGFFPSCEAGSMVPLSPAARGASDLPGTEPGLVRQTVVGRKFRQAPACSLTPDRDDHDADSNGNPGKAVSFHLMVVVTSVTPPDRLNCFNPWVRAESRARQRRPPRQAVTDGGIRGGSAIPGKCCEQVTR
jgi:hypothetical protein